LSLLLETTTVLVNVLLVLLSNEFAFNVWKTAFFAACNLIVIPGQQTWITTFAGNVQCMCTSVVSPLLTVTDKQFVNTMSA